MKQALGHFARGVRHVALAIFFWKTAHVPRRNLAQVGINALFPSGSDTFVLALDFIAWDSEAITVCVVLAFSISPLRDAFSTFFFADLPPGVDPCGETANSTRLFSTAPYLKHRFSFVPAKELCVTDFVLRPVAGVSGDQT